MTRWLANLIDLPSRSIAVRWVLYVVAAAGIGIGALLLVTYREVHHQVEAQGAAIQQLAKQKTAERIHAEISLVEYRLNTLFEGLERNLLSVVSLRSSVVAVSHVNDVVIANEIGQRLVKTGFNGAVVLDSRMNVIGTDKTGAELLAANAALKLHDLYPVLTRFFERADRTKPKAYRHTGVLDASHEAVLLAPVRNDYGILLAAPVFDDFGEPIALVLAFRTLQPTEAPISEFAAVTDSKIALMVAGRPVTVAGASIDQIVFLPETPGGLIAVPDLQASALCRMSLPNLSICVMRQNAEIDRFSDEIMAIGRDQFARTRTTLTSIGGISVLIILLILIGLGRRLARPLSEITSAVDLVARGEWRVEVKHTARRDEIGRIARAISAMQVSIAERDRMRQEMVRIDAINQRRLVLDNAVARFEDGMAVVMKNISDTVHTLAETNDVLDAAARQADSQAEKIRNTSMITASRTTVVSRTTSELSRTIRQIGQRIRNTSSSVHQSETHALAAKTKLGEVTDMAHGVEDAFASLQGFVADLGHLSLKATIEAAEAGEAGQKFSPLAQSVSALAVKAAAATDHIMQELARLGAVADGAIGDITEVRDVLGEALRETTEISVAVEEQDAATREISEGLSNSATALLGLAEAVDHLRANMSSAHEASADFVITARRIADDAKLIDASIRTLVRDVVR